MQEIREALRRLYETRPYTAWVILAAPDVAVALAGESATAITVHTAVMHPGTWQILSTESEAGAILPGTGDRGQLFNTPDIW